MVLLPNAKMPVVLVPAAEPPFDAAVAAPPAETTHPEYVYLLRVVEATDDICPSANMAKLPSADGVTLLLNALIGEGP
jgi:hypothetical protein